MTDVLERPSELPFLPPDDFGPEALRRLVDIQAPSPTEKLQLGPTHEQALEAFEEGDYLAADTAYRELAEQLEERLHSASSELNGSLQGIGVEYGRLLFHWAVNEDARTRTVDTTQKFARLSSIDVVLERLANAQKIIEIAHEDGLASIEELSDIVEASESLWAEQDAWRHVSEKIKVSGRQ